MVVAILYAAIGSHGWLRVSSQSSYTARHGSGTQNTAIANDGLGLSLSH